MSKLTLSNSTKICIIGLGYVGMPLAVEFSKKYKVVGLDISKKKISNLLNFIDDTEEVDTETLEKVVLASNLELEKIGKGFLPTYNSEDVEGCDVYIVTVPTPVDSSNRPDLTALLSASKLVGKHISKNNVVIYESTTYPGCTEEDCIPVIEQESGLKFNTDFFAGYSPERINPGDKKNTLTSIKKITSGSNKGTEKFVDDLYNSIIKAGTFIASSIKVAEAAKVIENSQRDINIAFVNELSKVFNLMNIDTTEVLEAAGTKWNFLPFRPGLVGGHCIEVDPYYLAQKATQLGYHPEIILAGRRLNDSMPYYISSETVKLMIKKEIHIKSSSILVLGVTFKENCPDVRNSKVADIVKSIHEYTPNITIVDPHADPLEVKHEYNLSIDNDIPDQQFDAIILAVAHEAFRNINLKKYLKPNSVVYDCKSFFDKNIVDARL